MRLAPPLPSAMTWEANTFYHPWVLRQVPATAERALDVGCGTGLLARTLAARVAHVDAVDADPRMIEAAREASTGMPVPWLLGDVLELPLDGGYDVVTAVSSLHHLPLVAGLQRLASLVRPGGTVVVIGHYRQTAPVDLALEPLRLLAYGTIGAGRAALGRGGKPHEVGMPVREPSTTLTEVSAAARTVMPGAAVRRRLFRRYSLLWHRPG